MIERFYSWLRLHPYAKWVYPVLISLSVILLLAAQVIESAYIWLYICLAALFVYTFRPSAMAHRITLENRNLCKKVCSVVVAAATIGVCVLPMDQLPIWNGEIPDHRNQYELMAEAILDGRIDFAYGDEDTLSQLKNPYDPNERQEAGVYYHWDHAYYDGHYYMYFGIVPVFLAFLPYRVITGRALTTFHGTQYFVALAIAGIFVLFDLLAKRFFRKMPYGVYLSLAVAFSVMSVWYSTAEPALYCTAITSAIALEVWSLYFFIRAVWWEKEENRQILYASIGALLGALVFGCRPPIALANILVIPMLIEFLRQRKCTWKLMGKLVLAASPYVAVAVVLMVYNYVRFDDPFEFGQAYQLTVADQSQYRVTLDSATMVRLINNTMANFFGIGNLTVAFPYLTTTSVFANFPILLLSVFVFAPPVFRNMRQQRLLPLMIGLFATVLIITAMDIMWTPYLLERYRMDIYFLMGIGCFLVIGQLFGACDLKKRGFLSSVVVVLALITTVSAFLLCVRTVGVYYPDKVTEIANALHLS